MDARPYRQTESDAERSPPDSRRSESPPSGIGDVCRRKRYLLERSERTPATPTSRRFPYRTNRTNHLILCKSPDTLQVSPYRTVLGE